MSRTIIPGFMCSRFSDAVQPCELAVYHDEGTVMRVDYERRRVTIQLSDDATIPNVGSGVTVRYLDVADRDAMDNGVRG